MWHNGKKKFPEEGKKKVDKKKTAEGTEQLKY